MTRLSLPIFLVDLALAQRERIYALELYVAELEEELTTREERECA